MTKVAGSTKVFYEERMIIVKVKRMWRRIFTLDWPRLPSRDVGAWWAAIYGVAQSQTRLK